MPKNSNTFTESPRTKKAKPSLMDYFFNVPEYEKDKKEYDRLRAADSTYHVNKAKKKTKTSGKTSDGKAPMSNTTNPPRPKPTKRK
jgi:hypothetical protein